VRVLDLFSGIGGFSLGLERAGMETVAFCEYDKFCQQVLKKHWPHIPIHDDVRTLDAKQYRGAVDVVCGGFPCQPFSVAGKQQGKSDERHLWPEMLRIIRECQPTWVIGENVSGFVNMALDDCWADLEAEGYEVQPFIIPACGVEAHHRRDRCWIVAYSERNGRSAEQITRSITEAALQQQERQDNTFNTQGAGELSATSGNVAYSNSKRELQQEGVKRNVWGRACNSGKTMADPRHECRWRWPESRSQKGETIDYCGSTFPNASTEGLERLCISGGIDKGSNKARRADHPAESCHHGKIMANPKRQRKQRSGQYAESFDTEEGSNREADWTHNGSKGNDTVRFSESRLDGTFNGLPDWMDGFEYIGNPDRFGTARVTTRKDGRAQRLKQLGNSVVPQIPEIIGRAIMSVHHD